MEISSEAIRFTPPQSALDSIYNEYIKARDDAYIHAWAKGMALFNELALSAGYERVDDGGVIVKYKIDTVVVEVEFYVDDLEFECLQRYEFCSRCIARADTPEDLLEEIKKNIIF